MDDRITIRAFTSKDIPFGMMLKDIAGWNQLPADWERFIAGDPEGCFMARYDGQDVGTVTLTGYEQRFGWVGMVLVHPDVRRKGIGTALMLHGIGYLEKKGVLAVKLDATATGKQLYETIGFVNEYLLERRQGIGKENHIRDALTVRSGVIENLYNYDLPIFGADRSRILRHLAFEPGVHTGIARDSHGGILGYIMVCRGANRYYIGPWIADNAEVDQCLWRWALSRIQGEPFFVDVCLANPDVDDIVPKSLFTAERQLIRMVRGENRYPGRPESVFGISGPEMG